MKKVLLFAFAALLLTGCQMSDYAPSISRGYKVFTGTIVDEDTRAALVGDGDIYHVTWNLDDKILINDLPFKATVGDVTTTYFAQDTTGDNSNEPPAAPYKAVYPYTIGRGMPSVQNYAGNNVEILPMYAESDNENLAFKNMTGILKLNIRTSDAGIVVKKIVITADQPMSGEYTVENYAAVISSGTEGVTLNCGEGVAISDDPVPVPFLVTVPANTYTGMTIKVYTVDGKVASVKMKSGASVTVERSKVYAADFPFNGFTKIDGLGGNALLPSGQDFNTAIKQLALEDEIANYSTVDETCVTRIVFNTLCPETSGIEIHDLTSDKPIYLVYDKTTGVVTINTPAETICTNESAAFMFANFGSLKYIDNLKCLNTENATSMERMFYYVNCKNRELRKVDLSNFNTSNVTNMLSMFNGCRNLTTLDVSSFNTELVEDMSYMFQYCVNIEELDLSNFNTECVTNMRNMIAYCYKLLNVNLSSFNTENVLNLAYFLAGCKVLPAADLSSFNTENCTDFNNIFRNCYAITDIKIPNFNIENAKDVRSFFYACESLQTIDVSMLDGSHMTKNVGYFFYHDPCLREIIAGDTFRLGAKTNSFIDNYDPFEVRAGSVFGSLTIYCDQDIANWFTTTATRWINSGYCGSNPPVQPIPVYFKHYKTGADISVEWPAN